MGVFPKIEAALDPSKVCMTIRVDLYAGKFAVIRSAATARSAVPCSHVDVD